MNFKGRKKGWSPWTPTGSIISLENINFFNASVSGRGAWHLNLN